MLTSGVRHLYGIVLAQGVGRVIDDLVGRF
jgi:hypothetical protein